MRQIMHPLFCILFACIPQFSAIASESKALEALKLTRERFQKLRLRAFGNESYTDYSPAAFDERLEAQKSLLDKISAIDRSELPHYGQVTYDMLRWDVDVAIERGRYQWLWFPYTPYSFTLGGPNTMLTNFRFESDGDVAEYLDLVGQYPAVLDSMSEHISGQKLNGIYLQRDVAKKVRQMIAGFEQAPEESFVWPTADRLERISEARIRKMQAALETFIANHVNPAIRQLADEFDERYQNRAPSRYGLTQYPGGKEYYKVLVKYHLTVDKTPEELFRESEAALTAIESELKSLRAEMDYFGDRATFDATLAADPKFKAKNPDDVERVYLDYMARMDPFLPALFCRTAPYGYGVQRASPEQEAALNFGYADTQERPVKLGVYYYNGLSLDQRSLLPAQALIYHEIAPGHYWHAAMRTYSRMQGRSGAFGEAWGDFGQVLAYEQGVFETAEEKYGRRIFNAMFHARALADVGINYFGYDFEWGRNILDRYTFESDLENLGSLQRDTTDWQAQILPYSFGSQELLRLREKIRFALGDKFSEPRFYDAVLATGGVPFPVLEKHLDWFVEQELSGGAPGICEE